MERTTKTVDAFVGASLNSLSKNIKNRSNYRLNRVARTIALLVLTSVGLCNIGD